MYPITAYLEDYERGSNVLSDSSRSPIGRLSHLRHFLTMWFVELAWVHVMKTP